MMTHEDIKEALEACAMDRCDNCQLRKCGGDCVELLCMNSLRLVNQLEEQISLMKLQMRGDCGTCKHRTTGFFEEPCFSCMSERTRPAWEYEGLPEVESK